MTGIEAPKGPRREEILGRARAMVPMLRRLLKYKIAAFVISSLPSGVAGLLFALNSGFIDPLIALGSSGAFCRR